MNKIFDPSGVGVKGKLFGLPYSQEESNLVIIPVPWEVTTSYGGGTSMAPAAILDASSQVDLSLKGVFEPWSMKMSMAEISDDRLRESKKLKSSAQQIIHYLESIGSVLTPELSELQNHINKGCISLHESVYEQGVKMIREGKLVGLLGGDHSTPYGLIKALAEHHEFGILQIDAHMDLRESYEGFAHSHASIMRNVIGIKGVNSITQVGIRDFCQEEKDFVESCDKEICVFYDEELASRQYEGESYQSIATEIMATLPEKVYLSFDIDGLDPGLCPNTGTPVPGGLTFNQAYYLIWSLVKSGRTIIGFDLNEVSPCSDEWDANVGARMLYRMACLTGVSNGLLQFE